jgi:WD40-like Beta Propeller Repeat
MDRRFLPSAGIPILFLACCMALAPKSHATCGDSPICCPNVSWNLGDSLAACPAGDTLAFTHPASHLHPSKLRIVVVYTDNDCNPRVGVPAESISVSWSTLNGNAQLNDLALNTFADGPTDASGKTRITISSISGVGAITVFLKVSGASQGSHKVVIRTTDANADGRSTSTDASQNVDITYDGLNGQDASLILSHAQHWHRHVLHGALVKRTTLCNTCPPNSFNIIGEGTIAWSPSGRNVAYSAMDTCPTCSPLKRNRCRVQFVRADFGSAARQLTYNTQAADSADYDPAWSPDGRYMYYVREDLVIHRKGIPGYSADTSDIAVMGDTLQSRFGLAINPTGDSLVYSQYDGAHFHIVIASASGGSARQVTSGNASYYFPQWSQDGAQLIAHRLVDGMTHAEAYRIDLRTGAQGTYYSSANADILEPSFAPDSQVVVASQGASGAVPHSIVIDASGSGAGTTMTAYEEYLHSNPFPRVTPTGTRLALLARDPGIPGASMPNLFVARQNMNTPPTIQSIGSQNLADTTVLVTVDCVRNLQSVITVTASDVEGDQLAFAATGLTNGMVFSSGTHQLTWTPTAAVGSVFNVRCYVTTPSNGGSDAALLRLTVVSGLRGGALEEARVRSTSALAFSVPANVERPILDVFDVLGRRVCRVVGSQGGVIEWNGESQRGGKVDQGVYLYRLLLGEKACAGRVAIVK